MFNDKTRKNIKMAMITMRWFVKVVSQFFECFLVFGALKQQSSPIPGTSHAFHEKILQSKTISLIVLFSFWTMSALADSFHISHYFAEGSLVGSNRLEANTLFMNFKDAILGGQILIPLLLALVAGFLTSLSPCVYPLIPITLSVMGARKYDSHLQGFLMSLSYVIGMSVIYTLLGALFASIGMVLGSIMQHPTVIIAIALLFILLSSSMLGAFDLVLPERVMTKLAHIGGHGIRGAFLMGLVAGLLAAPCTGPVIGFILALIANQGNVTLGIFLMFAFSLGLGAPFLILGTFSSMMSRIPKSGTWTKNIKLLFGAAMLGAAFYYLSLVIPFFSGLLGLIINLGIGYSVGILAAGLITLLLHQNIFKHHIFENIQIAVGAVVSALAIAALLFSDIAVPKDAVLMESNLVWHLIDEKTHDEKAFDNLMQQAKDQKKPMMIDFYADWCVACKLFEQKTFKDQTVSSRLKELFLVRIDATKTSKVLTKLQSRFNVVGLPAIIFIDRAGKIMPDMKVLGYLSPEQFFWVLEKIGF